MLLEPCRGVAFAVVLLVAPVAGANIAAAQRNPGTVGAARTLIPTALVVDSEDLVFRCDEDGVGTVHCAFTATYRVRNPTDLRIEATAAFYGLDTRDVEVSIDGAPAGRPLSDAEATALDDAVAPEEGSIALRRRVRETAERTGFDLALDGGGTAEVVAQGTVRAAERFQPGGSIPAIHTRHLVLHHQIGGAAAEKVDLDYLLAPLETWGDVGEVRIEVECPAEWGLEATLSEGEAGEVWPGAPEAGWVVTEANGRRTARFVSADPLPPILALAFGRVPPPAFHHGGGVLGFGGTLGAGGGEFQMRFGWEVAFPEYLIYSVNFDTDFDDRLLISPTIAFATPLPYLPVIPSFDAAVGPVFQALPEFLAGIRLQAGLSWGPVGFGATFDLFPQLDTGHPDFAQIGLYGLVLF